MPTLAKRGSPGKPEIIKNEGKGSRTLPDKSVLMDLVKGKKTINDYSKAGTSIDDYAPAKPR
jgi:hypothetical protein